MLLWNLVAYTRTEVDREKSQQSVWAREARRGKLGVC